ncbi:methyltransferase domain-containing protein [Flavisolibacter tropicus]|uniref:SAM-dependent methyltransferase n=1 Tax=Flavisolibacter tropicus TaxID=1492898 RepID=A0A172TUT2_9BACT|nr:methyltransferase domain-containing protein [Flavisolibacter tropicus]ANE50497.1 SAM-dependent methyltransferase [Flavisolibacter tropicus]
MPSFKYRSYQQELLDGNAIPFEAIRQNMAELDTINHLLGGHRITLKGVQLLVANHTKQNWNIVEIGCGGGDNLRVIKKWAAKNHIDVTLAGIDINKECVEYAKQNVANQGIQFLVSDYRDVQFDQKPDIIFSSLFSHHFKDDELVDQLKWMNANSQKGFFINDLQRHPVAYYSIKLLTQLFSKSYLVKNDAPISVMRGFHKEEWRRLLKKAGLHNVLCRWEWAFRWLIICSI